MVWRPRLPPHRRSRCGPTNYHAMTKILAISLAAFALSACSSMYGTPSGGVAPNSGATQNSTDSNKAGNPAAVSPGTGAK